MKRWGWVFIIGIVCSACQAPSTHTEAYVFGTLVEIQIDEVPTAQAQQASNAVLARYQSLHRQLHAWQASELTQLNTAIATGRTPFHTSPLLKRVLVDAQRLSTQSNGLFNPALGGLIALWGFDQAPFKARTVSPQAVHTLLSQHPSMDALVMDQAGVFSRNRAVQLDLGGYAKGFALDEGRAILQAMGIKHALINIGGNVIALGTHHGRPWRVGIQHPRLAGALAALDLADGWAIGTSGDYQRFYMHNGQRFCHILDPNTGYPAQASQSATVLIAPQKQAGVLSDVASKPLFIAPTQAATFAKQLGVAAWMVVDAQGKLTLNSAMQARITWLMPISPPNILP